MKKAFTFKKYTHPKYNWRVFFPDKNGERTYKPFKTKSDAETFRDQGNIQATNDGIEVASFNVEASREYLDAHKLLKPFNISILNVAKIFVKSSKELEPFHIDIPTAISQFKEWNTAKEKSTNLENAYKLYMEDCELKEKGKRLKEDQKSRLNRFYKRYE